MAIAHEPAVNEILNYIYKSQNNPFSFIDAGCGNGWVVKKVGSNPKCINAYGVDGSRKMIEKAKSNDPNGKYFCKNLLSWVPKNKADIVHSMEVFYYFKSPLILTRHIVQNWMNPGGQLVVGMDHYVGNKESYSWSKDLNVHMTLLSDNDWLEIFRESGLNKCQAWKANRTKDSPGTLVISGNLISAESNVTPA
jgi:trans-aconitate methyltransferase